MTSMHGAYISIEIVLTFSRVSRGILEVDEYDMNIYRPLSDNIEETKPIINIYCQKQHIKEMYRLLQKIRFVY